MLKTPGEPKQKPPRLLTSTTQWSAPIINTLYPLSFHALHVAFFPADYQAHPTSPISRSTYKVNATSPEFPAISRYKLVRKSQSTHPTPNADFASTLFLVLRSLSIQSFLILIINTIAVTTPSSNCAHSYLHQARCA